MEELVEQGCSEHTFERHVEVHEAGHAVAALDNGIPFSHIAMYGDEGKPGEYGGLYTTAGEVIMLDSDPVAYVAPDPVAAARFLFAGTCAELALLGHGSPNAERADMLCWRAGVGLPTDVPVTEEDLDSRVGTSFAALGDETGAWAQGMRAQNRISRLADHLGHLPRPSTTTYDQVVAIADGG
jgi:hypothetical protein